MFCDNVTVKPYTPCTLYLLLSNNNKICYFTFIITATMIYCHVIKSPCSPHNGKVGQIICKGKGGWVKLSFSNNTIQRFKMKNLVWLTPAQYNPLQTLQMDSSTQWGQNTLTSSEPKSCQGNEDTNISLSTLNSSISTSSTTNSFVSTSSVSTSSTTSSSSWSSSIKKSIMFHIGRSDSSLDEVYWEQSDNSQESGRYSLGSETYAMTHWQRRIDKDALTKMHWQRHIDKDALTKVH